jgi:hypothetical protein
MWDNWTYIIMKVLHSTPLLSKLAKKKVSDFLAVVVNPAKWFSYIPWQFTLFVTALHTQNFKTNYQFCFEKTFSYS